MRKSLLAAVLLIPVIAVAAYSAAWYIHANQAKGFIEESVAKLNQTQQMVAYERIETGGFPGKIEVRVIKPSFSGDMSVLLGDFIRSLRADSAAAPDAPLPVWTEKLALDGTITGSADILSGQYTLTQQGAFTSDSSVNGQAIALVTTGEGAMRCAAQIDRGGLLANILSFGKLDSDKFTEQFRSLECTSPARRITDKATGAPVADLGLWRLLVATAPQPGGQRSVNVHLSQGDTVTTERFDTLLEAYYAILTPPGQPFPASMRMSMLGKQNLAFKLDYLGPESFEQANVNQAFTINMPQLAFSNALYSLNAQFHVNNQLADGTPSGKFMLKADTGFGKHYDDWMKISVRETVRDIAGAARTDGTMPPQLQAYSDDELYAIVLPAVPQLEALGKVIQSVDLTYKAKEDFSTGEANLADFEFSAGPYGVKARGAMKKEPQGMFPSGSLNVTCMQCLPMIDVLTAYLKRVQSVMAYFDPASAAGYTIDEPFVAALKNFLLALADPHPTSAAEPETLLFTITSDGAAQFAVGGKPMDQVMTLFAEHMAPVMPQPNAAGATPPAVLEVPPGELQPAGTATY